MDRPFAIYDKFGEEVETYKDQDRLLDALYGMYRRSWRLVGFQGRLTMKTMTLTYTDENEQMHVLGYGDDTRLHKWYTQMDQLVRDLREQGTDIYGLADYVTLAEGWPIAYDECDCSSTTLCFTRYVAEVDIDTDAQAWDRGATRNEALARAFLTRKQHGQS